YVSNRYLISSPRAHFDVEWAYCFDVHLNAILPLVAVLHIVQLPFLKVLPFLRNTHVLLVPLTGLFFLYILSVIAQWNMSGMLVRFYEYRVGHMRH
ncbi:unnamed protein product, partial [Didymodactylos carnosus]